MWATQALCLAIGALLVPMRPSVELLQRLGGFVMGKRPDWSDVLYAIAGILLFASIGVMLAWRG